MLFFRQGMRHPLAAHVSSASRNADNTLRVAVSGVLPCPHTPSSSEMKALHNPPFSFTSRIVKGRIIIPRGPIRTNRGLLTYAAEGPIFTGFILSSWRSGDQKRVKGYAQRGPELAGAGKSHGNTPVLDRRDCRCGHARAAFEFCLRKSPSESNLTKATLVCSFGLQSGVGNENPIDHGPRARTTLPIHSRPKALPIRDLREVSFTGSSRWKQPPGLEHHRTLCAIPHRCLSPGKVFTNLFLRRWPACNGPFTCWFSFRDDNQKATTSCLTNVFKPWERPRNTSWRILDFRTRWSTGRSLQDLFVLVDRSSVVVSQMLQVPLVPDDGKHIGNNNTFFCSTQTAGRA